MVELTPTAVTHIKAALDKRGSGLGIRVGIKPTGCNGYAYVLEYVDEDSLPEEYAFVEYVTDGVSVFVAPKDDALLNGVKLDYVKHGINEGFEFTNPQETGRCGCGTSFSV